MVVFISYPVSLADSPAGSSVFVTAVAWLQDILLGTVATSIAIVAIAAMGFGMLTGRINIRHGVSVILGCFILFGASSIVSSLRLAVGGDYAEAPPPVIAAPPPAPTPTPRPNPTKSPQPVDPYPGASMPFR